MKSGNAEAYRFEFGDPVIVVRPPKNILGDRALDERSEAMLGSKAVVSGKSVDGLGPIYRIQPQNLWVRECGLAPDHAIGDMSFKQIMSILKGKSTNGK